MFPDCYLIIFFKEFFVYFFSINKSAVCAIQVFNNIVILTLDNFGMFTRDSYIVNLNIASRIPSNDYFILIDF